MKKKLSRQRLWQLKKAAEGNCTSCGKKRNLYAQHCDECAVKARVLHRNYIASKGTVYKPWGITGKGRKPKI